MITQGVELTCDGDENEEDPMSEQPERGRDESAQQVDEQGATPDPARTKGEEQVDDALGGAQDAADGG